MTDAPGWPDPQRPGVPANPERDGAHALDDHGDELVLLWRHGWWIGPLGASSKPHELAARRARYLGPCHTPAEVAALVAGARREGMLAAAGIAEKRHKLWRVLHPDDARPFEVCDDVSACNDIAAAIRAAAEVKP